MRLFLDTNVLIDFYEHRSDFYGNALKLVVAADMGDVELWASAKSFSDIFYVMVKAGNSSEEVQDAFLSSASFLRICPVDQEDILSAAQCKWSDFEDCLINEGAQKVRADYLITRDKGGFDRSTIEAMSPDSFFSMLESEHGIVYEEVDL